jgi:hypothetical protein
MQAFCADRAVAPKPPPLEDLRGEIRGNNRERIQAAHPVTPLPGPKAREVIARDAQFVSPSYTRGYPMVAKSGRGAMVEDVDGNLFLDFAAGIAVVSTGHCHPRVVEAIQKQAAELIHISGTDFYLPNMVELAERLAALLPARKRRKFISATRARRPPKRPSSWRKYHTRRDKIIAFHGCFHGRTLGALSLTASKAVQRKGFGTLLGGVFHIPYPNSYRCPYGNPSPAMRRIGHVSGAEIFKRLVDPEEVAAIFIEPIRAKADTFPRRRNFCLSCSAFAGSTESFSCPTKCRAEWDAREVVGRRSRGHRAGHFVRGQGNCLGHAAFRDDCPRELDGLETGRARLDLRWQSGLRRRGARDHGFAGDGIH